jgi:hypothetical protein
MGVTAMKHAQDARATFRCAADERGQTQIRSGNNDLRKTGRIIALSLALSIGALTLVLLRASSSASSASASAEQVSINRDVTHDLSPPLRSLIQSEPEEIEVTPVQNPSPSPTPPDMTSPPGAKAAEQTTQGKRPSADVVANFDGLGVGLKGPQGTAVLRNPSDNSLAVGRDHIFQIVNTRMAIFSKQGKQFKTDRRSCLWPGANEYDLQRIRRRLRSHEQRRRSRSLRSTCRTLAGSDADLSAGACRGRISLSPAVMARLLNRVFPEERINPAARRRCLCPHRNWRNLRSRADSPRRRRCRALTRCVTP